MRKCKRCGKWTAQGYCNDCWVKTKPRKEKHIEFKMKCQNNSWPNCEFCLDSVDCKADERFLSLRVHEEDAELETE